VDFHREDELVASKPKVLYQSIQSDNCAVCAFGNLLSLYRMDITRTEAACVLDAYKCSSGAPVTRSVLLRAIGANLDILSKLSWKKIEPFSFQRLRQIALTSFNRRAPVLMTCEIRHKKRRLYGVHCLAAICLSDYGIELVDSLGRRDGQIPNATLHEKEYRGRWSVSGAPFVLTKDSAFVLMGLPPLPAALRLRSW
jgi:hypothetical protein